MAALNLEELIGKCRELTLALNKKAVSLTERDVNKANALLKEAQATIEISTDVLNKAFETNADPSVLLTFTVSTKPTLLAAIGMLERRIREINNQKD